MITRNALVKQILSNAIDSTIEYSLSKIECDISEDDILKITGAYMGILLKLAELNNNLDITLNEINDIVNEFENEI